jgi:hypothetical protein
MTESFLTRTDIEEISMKGARRAKNALNKAFRAMTKLRVLGKDVYPKNTDGQLSDSADRAKYLSNEADALLKELEEIFGRKIDPILNAEDYKRRMEHIEANRIRALNYKHNYKPSKKSAPVNSPDADLSHSDLAAKKSNDLDGIDIYSLIEEQDNDLNK